MLQLLKNYNIVLPVTCLCLFRSTMFQTKTKTQDNSIAKEKNKQTKTPDNSIAKGKKKQTKR
jgi:hypothetical protein